MFIYGIVVNKVARPKTALHVISEASVIVNAICMYVKKIVSEILLKLLCRQKNNFAN